MSFVWPAGFFCHRKGGGSEAEPAVSSAAQLRRELAADAIHCFDCFVERYLGIIAAKRHFCTGKSIGNRHGVSADTWNFYSAGDRITDESKDILESSGGSAQRLVWAAA